MKALIEKLSDEGLGINIQYKEYKIHTDVYFPDEQDGFILATNIFKDKVLVLTKTGTATEVVNKILEFLNK